MEEKIQLKIIDNKHYEDIFDIGETVIAEKFLKPVGFLGCGYYKISKKGISSFDYAWLDEDRFVKIG